MAENDSSKLMYADYKDKKTGEIALTVHSTSGDPLPKEAYDAAVKQWQAGAEPQGFLFIEPNSGVARTMSNIRKGYQDYVAQPVQKGAATVGRGTGTLAAAPGALLAYLAEKANAVPEGTSENVLAQGGNLGEGAANLLTSAVKRPETATATVGTALGAAASGGTTLIPQILSAFVGGTGGYMLGGGATGLTPRNAEMKPSAIAFEAMLAALNTGASGVLRNTLTKGGMSQKAIKQVADDVAELMSTEFRHLASDPNRFEIMLSTPNGLSRIAQSGLKALMGDVDDIAGNLGPRIQVVLPGTMSRGSQNTLRAQLRRVGEAGTDFLDDIGQGSNGNAALDRINDVMGNVRTLIDNEFSSMPQPARLRAVQQVEAVMSQYISELQRLQPASMLIHALRDSGAGTGFKVDAFQRVMRERFLGSNPFMERVGTAAARGADLTEGIDAAVHLGIPRSVLQALGIPDPRSLTAGNFLDTLLQMSNKAVRGPKIGERYVGTVRGSYPKATAVGAGVGYSTSQGIKSFLDEGERQ